MRETDRERYLLGSRPFLWMLKTRVEGEILAGKTVSPSQDLCLQVSWRLEDPPGYMAGWPKL